jgi:hypothetical protein
VIWIYTVLRLRACEMLEMLAILSHFGGTRIMLEKAQHGVLVKTNLDFSDPRYKSIRRLTSLDPSRSKHFWAVGSLQSAELGRVVGH